MQWQTSIAFGTIALLVPSRQEMLLKLVPAALIVLRDGVKAQGVNRTIAGGASAMPHP